MRKIIILASAVFLGKIIHLLGKVISAKLLHKLREVAALHKAVHLILYIFKILVRNAHFAYQILNGFYTKLLCAAEAIAYSRSVF